MSPTARIELFLAIILAVVNLPFVAFLFCNRNRTMPDFSKLNAATADLTTTVAKVEAFVASQNDASVQANIDSATAAVSDADAKLAALVPAAPVALIVSPTSITSAVGASITQALTVSGGTAPYSFSSSLADVSVDASGNVSGAPVAAETGEITVIDAAGASAVVSVTIS